jgi:hypothetical protein
MPSAAASGVMPWLLRAKVKVVIADGHLEVLGDLVLVNGLAHAHADLVGTGELAGIDAGLDSLKVALGGRQQVFALVRA